MMMALFSVSGASQPSEDAIRKLLEEPWYPNPSPKRERTGTVPHAAVSSAALMVQPEASPAAANFSISGPCRLPGQFQHRQGGQFPLSSFETQLTAVQTITISHRLVEALGLGAGYRPQRLGLQIIGAMLMPLLLDQVQMTTARYNVAFLAGFKKK